MIAFILAVPALVFAGIGQVQAHFLRSRILRLELDAAEQRRITRETAKYDLRSLLRSAATSLADEMSDEERIAGLDLDVLADLVGEDRAVELLDAPGAAEDILRNSGDAA